MSQLRTTIDPVSTNQLLNNLSLAIDEAKLVRSISNIEEQIYKIQNSTGPSPRTHFLERELNNLKQELALTRGKAEQALAG
jgi:hypothetical protein